MITASSLDRQAACPASSTLVQEDYSTKHAEEGSARHADRESAVLDDELDRLPEKVRELINPGAMACAEVAFAWNWRTGVGRQLILRSTRGYAEAGVTEDEIPGTSDLLIIDDNELTVVDYKGFRDNGARLQLLLYVACAVQVYKPKRVFAAIHYETGWLDRREIDLFDLESFAVEVRAAMTAEPRLNTGNHCNYCPAFNACPSQVNLLAVVADGSLEQKVAMVSLDDDTTAAQFRELYLRVQKLATRMRARVDARARTRAIPLGDGLVYGEREKLGNEKLDGDKLYELLREVHGQGIADAAVERSATKKRLKEALGALKLKSVAAEEKALLDRLRADAGATRETTTVVEEFRT